MHQGFIVPLDAVLALKAARISRDLKLPLADSVILATARSYLAVIWTQDVHFKGLEGVRYTEKVM
jgi:predicted nucleic acid-binding protein